MSTFAGKGLRSYPDQICGGRTKSTSILCRPGPNLLAGCQLVVNLMGIFIRNTSRTGAPPHLSSMASISIFIVFMDLKLAHAHTGTFEGSARESAWGGKRGEKFSVPSRKPEEIRQGCASANMSSSGNSNLGEPPPKRFKEDVVGEYIVVCEINSPAF